MDGGLGHWREGCNFFWILFKGAVASNLRPERFLFIEELGRLCQLVGA
jgi:hypothetical protein